MKHRIAYLTGAYPRATDTFIQREVAALRKLGHEVRTFAVRKPDASHRVGPQQVRETDRTEYLLDAGGLKILWANLMWLAAHPLRYLKTWGLALSARSPGLRSLIYQMFYLLEAGYLARRLRACGVEHLHNHFANSSCSVAMLTSELSGIPFSFTLHGPAIFFEPQRWRLDLKIRRAQFVACISRFCRSQAMIWAERDRWDRLHIVHCGVDPSRYAPKEHRGNGSNILFIGRLEAVKGVPVLLRAFAALSGSDASPTLRLVGDGPDRPALEAMAETLGLGGSVQFVGYRSADEVAADLAWADQLVLPSFAEGVPVVLMEAMASGLPVVATRVGGVGELVETGRSGWLVAPGDEQDLADRMATLMTDPQVRNRMGAAGRKTVEEAFDIHDEAQRLSQILIASMEGRAETIRPALDATREAVA